MRPGIKSRGLLGSLLFLLVFSSCKKEVIPPDDRNEPVFYVQGDFNYQQFLYKAGVDSFYTEPSCGLVGIYIDSFLIGRVAGYASTITDGTDSFVVLVVGNEFVSSHEKPRKVYLDSTLSFRTLEYDNYLLGGDVNIRVKRNGKWYTTMGTEQMLGVYFNIMSPAEDYVARGDSRPMKQVLVSFKAVLENEENRSEKIVIDNGRAVLPFTYED